jgi:acyl-CoA dehydrogenase
MIDFEVPKPTREVQRLAHAAAETHFRKIARYYDVHEHEEIKETEEIRKAMADIGLHTMAAMQKQGGKGGSLINILVREEYNWGDVGIGLGSSPLGLGNAAIMAVGTDEQKKRFGGRYACMAITEPCCGSDTASIQATAKLDPDTNEWILNGEKIFVTAGARSEIVVAWASLDRSMGRAAIKSFVIEKGTPGMTLTKLEHKLGIRASDTASIVFEDCRIPYENILGSPEIKPKQATKTGFKGAMKTFDVTRPMVAIQGVGVARAALDFTKQKLEEEGVEFSYDHGIHRLSVVQKAVLDMEANLEVARLLTWQAAVMLETGERNSLEASFAKAKAGRAATMITQKCVELLGPLGYSREWLLEKWMRDCKITDIYEGTGQIQMLVIARSILGFNRDQLR